MGLLTLLGLITCPGVQSGAQRHRVCNIVSIGDSHFAIHTEQRARAHCPSLLPLCLSA
eukprot:COSAG03_NODE_1212_length_4546_cov_2.416685_4_plen_58_part_00